jgi:hypothetical protein
MQRKETNLSLLAGERFHITLRTFTTAPSVVEADLAAEASAFVITRVVGNGAINVWDSCGASDSEEEREAENVESLHCTEVVDCL